MKFVFGVVLKPLNQTPQALTLTLILDLLLVFIFHQSMAFSGRMRDLMKKYGMVALGVHFSVSFTSIGGLYVAINNNVDVESLFHKIGLYSGVDNPESPSPSPSAADPTAVVLDSYEPPPTTARAETSKMRNRTAELAASSGGALALAVLCNKALLPIRVPITIALTPPIARFLARRNLIKSS